VIIAVLVVAFFAWLGITAYISHQDAEKRMQNHPRPVVP
jgi:uncharacterized protein YneF (UPF0154 family)